MSQHFEYRGDLAVTPLPEILATVHRYRVPGIVSLSREGRMRRIFLEDGLVIFAASNEREAGLDQYLQHHVVFGRKGCDRRDESPNRKCPPAQQRSLRAGKSSSAK